MSTAEVQVKVLTVADVSGIERAKASFTNLQSEIQNKMSAKGIGMSLLEGLGIGSGFRVADMLADQIVKPFKDAAEWAEKIAVSTQKAADATAEMMRYKRIRSLGEQQVLEEEVASLQKQLEAAKAARSKKTYVVDGVDSMGDVTRSILWEQAPEDIIKINELAVALNKAELARNRFNDGKSDKEKSGAGARIASEAKSLDDFVQELLKEEAALKREGQAVRESLDARKKLNAEIQRLLFLYSTGAISSEEAGNGIRKLNAEFDRPELILKSAQALEGYRDQLDAIEKNPLLTDKEKREARAVALAAENVEIKKQIQLWTELNAVAPDAANQDRIDQLNRDKRVNEASSIAPASRLDQANMGARNLGDSSQHYQGAGDGAQGGLVEALTEFGTMADQIAETIKTTIGGAVQSVTANLMGWINRTQTFGKALRNIGASVFNHFLQQIIQMGTQWLITQGLIKMGLIATHTTGEALKAASTTSTITQEVSKTPILATNAGLASVSSFGVAAILGIALLLAGIAALAFETGGMIPGGEKLIRVNEAGQESVLNARATSTLGSEFVNAVNSGNFAAASQMMSPLGGLTRPGFSPEMQEGGAGAAQAAQAGAMNIAVRGFNAQHEISQWMDSRDGRKTIVNLIDGRISHHS